MKNTTSRILSSAIIMAAATLALSACSKIKTEAKYPTGMDRGQGTDANDIYSKPATIWGKEGLKILTSKKEAGAGEGSIGVNSFLWRATLDTVSFMPLVSADPFGGVIITDWYTDPKSPKERIKINAFVLGRELKANGVRVSTFRQILKRGTWSDASVSKDTARKLEDAILTRARQLRVTQLAKAE